VAPEPKDGIVSSEEFFLEMISGRRRGALAAAMRAALSAAEIPYRGLMRLRNGLYDRRMLPSHRLPRPAVSIGNLTTGGTGKTPLVCWLAAAAQAMGRKPAVLMRGYKSNQGSSDEQREIEQFVPGTVVIANPDRVRAAAMALEKSPEIDLFILDDAMQHRRAARDVEIVLISAVCPWGLGHVLPRGLLRESPAGLRRADAIVLTHAGEVGKQRLDEIQTTVRRYNSRSPLFLADHALVGLLSADEVEEPMTALADKPYLVACGIGDPESFAASLARHGGVCVGRRFFPDHHHFTDADVIGLRRAAAQASAAAIIVTEKDWMKIRHLPAAQEAAGILRRAKLSIRFDASGQAKLLELIWQRTAK
jgi:tetraacyldisaccharide 4'-kinase